MELAKRHVTGPSGRMIRSISIKNFRCFESLDIAKCGRVNVVVGDNGSGKTALLEAIFLALGVVTELPLRYRQQRGLEGTFSGSSHAIEESIFGDLFFNRDWSDSIYIELAGTGEDNRSLRISRGSGEALLPLGTTQPKRAMATLPFVFTWRSATGHEYPLSPFFLNNNIQFPSTGEDLPSFFYFAANQPSNSTEAATLFSRLSRTYSDAAFKKIISQEFSLIRDISIEISGGAPVLHASVPGVREKLPVPAVSGAINRLLSILLSMAARPGGAILVDEMDNGVYYSHQKEVWSAVLSFAKEYDFQAFTTTHSPH